MRYKFSTATYLTAGIRHEVDESKDFAAFVMQSTRRHFTGDWGDSKDKEKNDIALERGGDRIFSVYTQPGADKKIWIITEYDRSATTILFPGEY